LNSFGLVWKKISNCSYVILGSDWPSNGNCCSRPGTNPGWPGKNVIKLLTHIWLIFVLS